LFIERAATLATKKVLFVDDEKSLALLGADLLTEFGCDVSCAFDGNEALELYHHPANKFDLVVTDESMPGMSGIELAQRIYKTNPETPVVLCSGHMLTMHEEGMAATNITAVLPKTSICSQLPSLIEEIFPS